MPLYRCLVEPGLTSREQRERIAKDIVRVHCGVTGAPASFVHAFFIETPGAALPNGKSVVILGSIRSGRNDGQKERIVSELTEAASNAIGLAVAQVGVYTVDVPASWVMEGGALLPEPGDETEWLEAHRG